jgi:hypothetical protein
MVVDFVAEDAETLGGPAFCAPAAPWAQHDVPVDAFPLQ